MSKNSSTCALIIASLILLVSAAAFAKPVERTTRERERRVDHRRDRRSSPPPVVATPPGIEVTATVEAEPIVSVRSRERVYRHSATRREVRYESAPEPAPSPSLRQKPDRLWHLGVNLGSGPMVAPARSAGLGASLDLYAGLRIGRFALQGEAWLHYRDYFQPGEGLGQSMAMLTAQLWLQEKLWVKAGFGGASLQQDGFEVAHGTALMAATGYDILDTRHLVFNAHLKAGTGLYRERGAVSSVSAGLGFTWY